MTSPTKNPDVLAAPLGRRAPNPRWSRPSAARAGSRYLRPPKLMTARTAEETYIAAGGQRIRVSVRRGTGVPLVLCNGIGASFEVLDPLVAELDADNTVIRFDVPGTGGSPVSVSPYGFPYVAWVLGRILTRLNVSVVDVLGLSWRGALAQQFALSKSTAVPTPCPRGYRNWDHDSGQSTGVGKDARAAQILRSGVCGVHRRRPLRRHCTPARKRRCAAFRAPTPRRVEDGLPAPAARWISLDKPAPRCRQYDSTR